MSVHVYGVTSSHLRPQGETPPGRQGGAVRLVTDDELAAIVSDVDETTAVGRQDLLSHAHVLEWFADRGTVLPMRFGIALSDDDAAREQVLRRERESLERLLGVLDDQIQVSVQAFLHEEPALREVLRRRPDLRAARDDLQGVPEELAQSRQVELGQAITAALEELQDEERTLVLDRLAPLARAVSENEPKGALEAVHAAFLVDRRARGEFDAAVAGLRTETEARLRVRYVGPQPPYSFLDAARNGDL
ncbi:MAG TPA: GvpL/GvpF family gas vesicle protein [Propionibacteriaceae bacterium]|nr:GvpL/GvpF family gas vesicle protein [Propionibacteriaceae bacterium]